jgi:hypothetical protein
MRISFWQFTRHHGAESQSARKPRVRRRVLDFGALCPFARWDGRRNGDRGLGCLEDQRVSVHRGHTQYHLVAFVQTRSDLRELTVADPGVNQQRLRATAPRRAQDPNGPLRRLLQCGGLAAVIVIPGLLAIADRQGLPMSSSRAAIGVRTMVLRLG